MCVCVCVCVCVCACVCTWGMWVNVHVNVHVQILRAIIHNEIRRIDPELKENEPEKYRRYFVNSTCACTLIHFSH